MKTNHRITALLHLSMNVCWPSKSPIVLMLGANILCCHQYMNVMKETYPCIRYVVMQYVTMLNLNSQLIFNSKYGPWMFKIAHVYFYLKTNKNLTSLVTQNWCGSLLNGLITYICTGCENVPFLTSHDFRFMLIILSFYLCLKGISCKLLSSKFHKNCACCSKFIESSVNVVLFPYIQTQ